MKKRTATIIQLTALFVFICCAVYLGKYYYDSYTANKAFSDLAQVVETAEEENGEEARAQNGMLGAYYELYQENNDLVGWIKVPDTEINYPVVQGADNEFYLRKSFEKEYQYSGMPFADWQCNVTKPSDNVIIYAHNMRDGSMFAGLLDYKDKEFAEAHKTIEFDTLYECAEYEILYAFRTRAGKTDEIKYHEFIDAGNQEDFYAFIEEIKKQAVYVNESNSAEYGDKLLTLSTCSYNASNERFVVVAKKIKT